MKKKSNIVASVLLPDGKFYVRANFKKISYNICRGNKVCSEEKDLTTAIAKMLRIAYFETKQTKLDFQSV